MRTRIDTIARLKALAVEMIMNHTLNVTKVSDGSVLSGVAYAMAKLGQKVQKEIALLESRKFPSSAFGQYLDDVAFEGGVSARFGATGSATEVLIVGDVGTTYTAGVHFFTGSHNITFELVSTVVIPSIGYVYAMVRSVSSGSKTNVDPLSVTIVNPTPSGHRYVINEFYATGGKDVEDDFTYRLRIRDTPNMIAQDTLAKLTQVFIKINPNTLKLFYYGIDDYGKTIIAVLTTNGAPLSGGEINDLLVRSSQYLALSDLRPFGSSQYGISIVNISWEPIDVEFRVNIHASYNPDNVRKDIQVAMSKYLDYRKWVPSVNRVEWDDLLSIVKNAEGVKYCPDTYFIPRVDIDINPSMLPRIRGFRMLDMDGVLISDGSGALNPIYFPSAPNTAYQTTVLITV